MPTLIDSKNALNPPMDPKFRNILTRGKYREYGLYSVTSSTMVPAGGLRTTLMNAAATHKSIPHAPTDLSNQ
jgi:hypothetical protein